jgi:DNA polymerase-3 subunit beta
MQFSIDQKILNQALTEAQRFVSAKALSPILGGISFTVSEDGTQLELRAASQQGQYQSKVALKSGTPGTAVFPASVVGQVVKAFDSGDVTVEPEGEAYLMHQKTVKFTLPPLAGDDFPAAPVLAGQEMVLPREAFLKACETVGVAASRDETKPVLTSILMEMSAPNALVTSDGFRLYRQEVDLALDVPKTVLLPSRTLKEVLAIMKRLEEAVVTAHWQEDAGQMMFVLGETVVQMSLVSGAFPPYRNIIPEATSFSVTLDRELLQQRIQQVMVMAKELSSIVILQPVVGDDGVEMEVASQAGGKGASSARVPALQTEGEVPRFACNGTYILDFLASIGDNDVTIQGNDPLKPVLIIVPGKKEILYLIMPFKLQN